MTKPSDNPAEPFKKALAEATKAMAGQPELTVAYSVDPPGCAAGAMRLPQVTRRMTRDEVLLARGTADAYALRLRYHDDATHRRYAPAGETAVALFEAMETARCEAVGARAMPGTAGNIDAKIADEARRLGYAEITDPAKAPLAQAAGYLVRQLATDRPLPKGAANVLELWRGFLESHAGGTLDGLDGVLGDQREFARFARKVIADLGYARPARRGPRRRGPGRQRRGRGRRRGRAGAGRRRGRRRRRRRGRRAGRDRRERLGAAGDAGVARRERGRRAGRGGRDGRGRAARRPPAAAAFRGRSRLQGLDHEVRRGDRGRGSGRPRRARPAARLSGPAARAAEGRGGAAGEPAAAAAAGAAEPRLGVRPRGGNARRRAAGAGDREPDDAAELQARARHRFPRYGGDAAAGQFRVDAGAADLDRGDLGGRAGAHAGALPGQGRDPRLHHPGVEGRAESRDLARRAAAGGAGAAERPAAYRLQGGRRAVAAGAGEPRADDEGGAAEGKHRRRGAGMGAPPAQRPAPRRDGC